MAEKLVNGFFVSYHIQSLIKCAYLMCILNITKKNRDLWVNVARTVSLPHKLAEVTTHHRQTTKDKPQAIQVTCHLLVWMKSNTCFLQDTCSPATAAFWTAAHATSHSKENSSLVYPGTPTSMRVMLSFLLMASSALLDSHPKTIVTSGFELSSNNSPNNKLFTFHKFT